MAVQKPCVALCVKQGWHKS